MEKPLDLRLFDIAEVDWTSHQEALSRVRREVFILEQKVAAEEEWDGQDQNACHWLATNTEGTAVGTARLLPNGQIGRMAVLADCRRKGIGSALLEQAMSRAARLGIATVFLHAQVQVRSFYEAAGFIVSGEEFTEAGMPHLPMTRALQPVDFRQNEIMPRPDPIAASLKQFDTREASWSTDRHWLNSIRERVFVREQNVPLEIEQDGRDESAYHWLAEDFEEFPIGTARLLPDGQIGRMAVLAEYRRRGIGASLLELAIQKARWLGLVEVFLHAQLEAEPFYRRSGFIRRGEEFIEAGIPHVEMTRALQPLQDRRKISSAAAGDRNGRAGEEYGGADRPHSPVLGGSNRVLLARNEEECRALSIDLARQAQMKLRIYSPWLDHTLYDNLEFYDALSQLARRNRHTEVQTLIWDSHRIVKNGHLVLELTRRLPSSMRIRIVHPDYRMINHDYILADDAGLIYRQDYETYKGYANFYDKTEVSRLGRDFLRAWETSYEDPNLRQIKI